jgi:hypothetical protein
MKNNEGYLVDWCILDPPRVLLGGVRMECAWGANSLILMPVDFYLTIFLALAGRVCEVVALRLPARVLEEPASELPNATSAGSTLGPRAEFGIAGKGVSCSPSNPGTCNTKLYRACSKPWSGEFLIQE